jgi:hypothetical protein
MKSKPKQNRNPIQINQNLKALNEKKKTFNKFFFKKITFDGNY